MKATVMLALSLCLCHPLAGQFTFDNVEARTAYGAAKEGNTGKLIIDAETIRFTKNKGDVYFSLPTKGVSDLFYSRVSGRRIGAAILVTHFSFLARGESTT